MSETPKSLHHAIDYIEITVTDIAAAKAFYGAAFGWNFTDYSDGYVGIQGIGEGAREMGGLAKAEGVSAGGPLVVLYSNDLDASLAAVKSAGGKITAEPFDFPGGRRFQFADPSGNELAVWTHT